MPRPWLWVAAVEIKWSDKHAQQPESLKGLLKFVRANRPPLAWATTRSEFNSYTTGGSEIRQWPAAAWHFTTVRAPFVVGLPIMKHESRV